MERQNLTISLPKPLLKRVKMLAVERDKTLTQLIREVLDNEINGSKRYKQARKKHADILTAGFDLGTKGELAISREELHARR